MSPPSSLPSTCPPSPRNPPTAAAANDDEDDFRHARPRLSMLVSLDHTIYFHDPLRVRADDWLLTDMESPWAGDGRGLVVQRIFARDGTLLATCVQEVGLLPPLSLAVTVQGPADVPTWSMQGVVRLEQDHVRDGAKL